MSELVSIQSLIVGHTKGITPKYVADSDVIVLNQKCIRNNGIDFSLSQFHDPSKSFSDAKAVKIGDILINSTGQGTAGRCAFVKKLPAGKKVVVDSHILIIRISGFYTAGCVEYSLFSIEKMLQTFMDGSTGQGEFDKQRLFNIYTALPDQTKRCAVYDFLNNLDAKIELNNRINAELEAMVKTLYDYWFVQFDFPDHNGKPYKSSGGKMAYNPTLKREIPTGWSVKQLGKIAKTSLGGTPATKNMDYWQDANIAWLSSAEVADFPVINSEQRITQKGIENSAAVLLPKGSVVISIVRYIRPSILGINAATNQSVVGILENKTLKKSFLYPFMCGEVSRLMGLRTGAQQPHINKGTIDESLVVFPSDDVLGNYYKTAEPIFAGIMTRAFETQRLTQLRDWLLPGLMNGQVTVV